MNQELTDSEFFFISEAIASRMGLHFPPVRRSILSRSLSSAAQEFGYQNLGEFVQMLLSTNLPDDQIEKLASYLTISETYFWREPNVFAAFSNDTLSKLVNSKGNNEKKISIWCAACSTGEEAYSIAIAIHKAIPDLEKWKITIIASDINAKTLSIARTGTYSSYSFRNAPEWLKNNYFIKSKTNDYQIIPAIKEMVTFSNFNLTNKNYFSTICRHQKMDIIFCRNVLMYFTNEWAEKVSQNLYNSLNDEGWLVVSSCELSSQLFPLFIAVNFPGAVLYSKAKEQISLRINHSEDSFNQLIHNFLPSILSSSAASAMEEASVASAMEEASVASAMEEALVYSSIPTTEMNENLLLENQISIRNLANTGHLNQALSACNDAIASDRLAPSLYFLRASILQELDKGPEAIKSLRQAIYVDPNYIMGHFTLGNLFSRQGAAKTSKRYFDNALDLLSRISKDATPAESEGLSAEHLRGIILNNLQTQESL